jgi:hypothetical protein
MLIAISALILLNADSDFCANCSEGAGGSLLKLLLGWGISSIGGLIYVCETVPVRSTSLIDETFVFFCFCGFLGGSIHGCYGGP